MSLCTKQQLRHQDWDITRSRQQTFTHIWLQGRVHWLQRRYVQLGEARYNGLEIECVNFHSLPRVIRLHIIILIDILVEGVVFKAWFLKWLIQKKETPPDRVSNTDKARGSMFLMQEKVRHCLSEKWLCEVEKTAVSTWGQHETTSINENGHACLSQKKLIGMNVLQRDCDALQSLIQNSWLSRMSWVFHVFSDTKDHERGQ